MKILLLPLALLSACATVSSHNSVALVSCVDRPSEYSARSVELSELYNADQGDRESSIDQIDWSKVNPRDLARRARVAEIFAEGCFKEARDYANAAMIYQHGQTADHVYQTFIWAKNAVDLGDKKSKWLMAAGLDRYLVRVGQKQLFATQATKETGSSCWCLEPVEPSIPEPMQTEYTKKTVQDQLRWINTLNEGQTSCPANRFCTHVLKPSPRGTVAGFW